MLAKITGIICILFSSFYIGYKNYNIFNLQIDFLEQYLYFVKYIEIKIKYEGSTLDEIIRGFETKSKYFAEFLKTYRENSHNGKKVRSAILEATNKFLDKLNISNNTKKIIDNFNFNLGCSDVDNQVKLFKITEKFLEKSIDFYYKEKTKKGKLYFLISICGGMIIILLFI